jgi:hypothetical protein
MAICCPRSTEASHMAQNDGEGDMGLTNSAADSNAGEDFCCGLELW